MAWIVQGDAIPRRYHAHGTVRRGLPAIQDADGMASRVALLGWKPNPVASASEQGDGALILPCP